MLREMFVETARQRHTEAASRAKAAGRAYLNSFATGDIDARVALFAADATFEDPIGSPPMQGHAALRAFWEGAAGMTVRMDLEHIAACANTCAMVFTATISIPAAGDGGESDGTSLRVVETLEVDDEGLIKTMRACFHEESIR